VLIPSLYATSLRTRSLRPVRVPSDQNTRWRLPFHFSTNKRHEFLVSTHLPHKIRFWGWMFSPRRRTRTTVQWWNKSSSKDGWNYIKVESVIDWCLYKKLVKFRYTYIIDMCVCVCLVSICYNMFLCYKNNFIFQVYHRLGQNIRSYIAFFFV